MAYLSVVGRPPAVVRPGSGSVRIHSRNRLIGQGHTGQHSRVRLRTIVAAVYLLVLLGAYYKQHQFLFSLWKSKSSERSADPQSGIHFVRQLREIQRHLSCSRPVTLYHGLPDEYSDFHVPMLTRFALSPCRVEFSREALPRHGLSSEEFSPQLLLHASHPDYLQNLPGRIAGPFLLISFSPPGRGVR